MISRGFKPEHQLPVPPEVAGFARAAHEWKRPLGVIVNRGIKLADDVVEHPRRDGKRRPAVAAFGGMAHSMGRCLREVDGLVLVGGDAATSEVLAESTVAQKDNVVAVAILLRRRPATARAAPEIAHADKRALVKQVERQRIMIKVLRHDRHRTGSIAAREYRAAHDGANWPTSAALCR